MTGECLPLAELAGLAHAHGARIAVDGAQLVPHRRVDLAASGIDYLAFSGHKIYAPFGSRGAHRPRATGWTPPRRTWPAAARSARSASDATDWAASPARHEGGTPNVVGAVALAAACRLVDSLPAGAVRGARGVPRRPPGRRARRDRRGAHPAAVARRSAGPESIGVVTFTVDGWPAQHVAQYLSAEHGIGVRDGRFCAHPLLARLTPVSAVPDGAAVRASLGLGSRAADVDRLVDALGALRAHGPSWAYAGAADGYAPVPDPRVLPGLADRPPGRPVLACPRRPEHVRRLTAQGRCDPDSVAVGSMLEPTSAWRI